MIRPQHEINFNIGNITKGELVNKTISFKNEFGNPYNIRKITPYCPCIKIIKYTDLGVYPVNHVFDTADKINNPLEEEVRPTDSWDIHFTIKKSYLGQSSTTMEVILESPFDTEQFVIIEIKYNTTSK